MNKSGAFGRTGIGYAALCSLVLAVLSGRVAGPAFAGDDQAGTQAHGPSAVQTISPAPDRTLDTAAPPLDDEAARCADQPYSFKKIACLSDYFQGLTRKRSAKYAIEQARAFVASDKIEDCHLVAHMVGKATIVKYGYDLKGALQACPMSCVQGCIHGVVQGYIAHRLTRHNLMRDVSRVCDGTKDNPLLRRQCVHGVGHGLLTGQHIPLSKAIGLCRRFDGEEVKTCWGGLFMEHMHAVLHLEEPALRRRLPHLCTGVDKMKDEVLTRYCYDSVGEGLMFYTGHDLRHSLQLCDLVSGNRDKRNFCRRAAIAEAWSAPATIDLSVCRLVSDENRQLCTRLKNRLKTAPHHQG